MVSHLQYGAAYYPWLISSFEHTFHLNELEFWDVADSSKPVSIPPSKWDAFSHDDLTLDDVLRQRRLVDRARNQSNNIVQFLERFAEFNIKRNNFSELFDRLQNFVLLLQGAKEDERPAIFQGSIELMRKAVLIWPELEAHIEDYTFDFQLILERFLIRRDLTEALAQIVAVERLEQVRSLSDKPRTSDQVNEYYEALIHSEWYTPSGTPPSESNYFAIWKAALASVADAATKLFEQAGGLEAEAEEVLFAGHPFFGEVATAIRLKRKELPPSGAMAGVYATTDRSFGVWTAPANVAVQATLGPTQVLDSHDQEDFNVDPAGKSINVIRPLRGRGIRVWGARTLTGNDLEWRYVSVRRYFNFVEEFVRKTTEPYVFEPNDESTWQEIRLALDHFLTAQWRRGALAGSVTNQAYYVSVGLGETMTSLDILEGRLIIDIGLAVVRPAEFIVIRYICRIEGGS